MTFTFRGGLAATLAEGFEEPLSGVTVRLYGAQATEEAYLSHASTAARPKETFSILDEDEVAGKDAALLAAGETDERGRFEIDIPEGAEYPEDEYGRPAVFQVDVRVETVPWMDLEPKRPVQFTVTTHQPRWREGQDGHVADWDATIPRRNWCAVLELLGVWMVCGRVTICDTTEPVAELTVTAKDADIVQHDELGSAVTDSNGHFCIYYSREDFEETPSPWPSIELTPGPDLYFHIEHAGQTRLEEDSSRGRQGARENAGHCEYVDLCVDPRDGDDGGQDTGTTPVPTYWRRIGSAFNAPFLFPGTSDFDEYGYAGSNKYALTGQLTMEGTAPLYHSEDADQFVQYRFLVSENATSNPGPAPSGFQPIGVGSGPHAAAFVEGVTVGEVLVYDSATNRIRPVPVDVNDRHIVGRGWISVRQAVDDALNAAVGTDLAALPDRHYFGWNDSDPLAGIDSREFTDEPDVADASAPDPVPEAGDSVPSSRRIDVEKIAIKFEARVVDGSGSVVSSPAHASSILSGTTLNAVVVNNNDVFSKFENVEHAANPCKPLNSDVHLAYTVYHPHIEGVELDVRRNDGADEEIDDPDNEVSFDPSFSFTSGPGGTIHDIRHFADDKLPIRGNTDNPILTKNCGYVARLRVRPRLHNGYSAVGWQFHGEDIFCWNGSSS